MGQVVLSVQMGGPTRTSAQIRERYRFLSTRLFWSFAQYVQQAAVPQPDYNALQGGDQRYYQHMQSSEGMVVPHDGQIHDQAVYQHSQGMDGVPGMHPSVHDQVHAMHATGHEDVHAMHPGVHNGVHGVHQGMHDGVDITGTHHQVHHHEVAPHDHDAHIIEELNRASNLHNA